MSYDFDSSLQRKMKKQGIQITGNIDNRAIESIE